MTAIQRDVEARSGRPPAPANAGQMLAMARQFLERKGREEARLEAELLVAHALGVDRLGLYMRLEVPVEDHEIDRARDLLVRRGRAEPVAYITGAREFYGRSFEVGPGVLVPRPETEGLVDRAREIIGTRAGARILDVGTGSGCIAVTLALELEDAKVWAVDVSEEALAYARRNTERLAAGVELLAGEDWTPALPHAPFDLVACNPPYIELRERDSLPADVREHEPALALFAPADDPDHWVRRLLDAAPTLLAPGSTLLVELGHDQAARARTLATARGFTPVLHADLAGIERVLEVRQCGV